MKKPLLIIAFIILSSLSACKNEEKSLPVQESPKPLGTSTKEEGFTMDTPPIDKDPNLQKKIIEVPDEIQNTWSAVEIEVIDKEKSDKKETYTLKKGEEITIKGSDLKISVLHFIPHFTMGSGVLTSLDAEPTNPAVHIRVTEKGAEIFDNVIFQKYPDTHAFEHKKYSISMKNYVPVKKK